MALRFAGILLFLICGTTISGCGSSRSEPPPLLSAGSGRNAFPEDCLEVQENLKDSGAALEDGVYQLFLDGDERSPWMGYCRGMKWEEPQEYILVDPETNWSSAYVGGSSLITTRFSKLRFYPDTLTVDAGDAFGAKTLNWPDKRPDSWPDYWPDWTLNTRVDLPAGFAAYAAAGSIATASIDLRGSGFRFDGLTVVEAPSTFLCATAGANYSVNPDLARIEMSAGDPVGSYVFTADNCAAQGPWGAAPYSLWPVNYSGD